MFRERAEEVGGIVCIPLEPRRYTDMPLVWKEEKPLPADRKAVIRYLKEKKEARNV